MNLKLIITKLAGLVVVLLGVSFFTFLLLYMSPSDPAEIMLSVDGVIPTEELVEQTRVEMGLDKPMLIQYTDWISGVAQGDFGTSYVSKAPVLTIIGQYLPATLLLTIMSVVMMLAISIPLGVLSSVYSNTIFDYFIKAFTFIGVSIPSFWLGLIFLSFFGLKLGLVSIAFPDISISGLFLPALTLAIPMSSKYTRQIRTICLEELNKDYVRAARIRGYDTFTIMTKEVLPNILIPVITLLGISVGSLLGGSAIIETVYNIPGIGLMAVDAVTARDYPLVQGYVLLIALAYMLIMMLVDFISYGLNPYARRKYETLAVYKRK